MESKTVTQAKKNFRDYKIIEKFVAGIVLNGNEIKSIRGNQVSVNEAYILPQEKEMFIVNMNITPYKHSYSGDLKKGDSKRKRKLLLKRKEINEISINSKTKNLSIIPLKLFISSKGWAKLEIALAQRLKKYQLKNNIKEKEIKRKIQKGDWY